MQGKFWQMHNLIYEHQKDWKDLFDVRPVFDGYAREIGLDVDRFKRDLASARFSKESSWMASAHNHSEVSGTPTVFLNGREVPFESLPADKLRVLIQKEIDSKIANCFPIADCQLPIANYVIANPEVLKLAIGNRQLGNVRRSSFLSSLVSQTHSISPSSTSAAVSKMHNNLRLLGSFE